MGLWGPAVQLCPWGAEMSLVPAERFWSCKRDQMASMSPQRRGFEAEKVFLPSFSTISDSAFRASAKGQP